MVNLMERQVAVEREVSEEQRTREGRPLSVAQLAHMEQAAQTSVDYMEAFGMDEINLMCIYATRTRKGLIRDLEQALPDMDREEGELVALVHQVIGKLGNISDEAFKTLVLVPDWKD
jgi:hypothetical protein